MDRLQQDLRCENFTTTEGTPTGGRVVGVGISIDWQDGPLGRPPDEQVPNGAFVETVIRAALQRLEFFNESKFRCRENSLAITHLQEALHWLQHRREDREARGVQGLHQV